MTSPEASFQAVQVLASSSFFAHLAEAGRKRLARLAVWRHFQKGEVIFRDGDPAPGVFIVASGLVRVYKLAPSGKEHVLHLANPGMTFAEVAVLGEFPCPASAEALERTTCLLLPTDSFLRALRDDHGLCLQILSGMAVWVRSLVSLLEGVVLRDAAGRVASYLLEAQQEPGGLVSLPGLKKHLANHLNLTSETLSRVLRRLREEQLIRETDAGLTIEDARGLKQVAEDFYPRV